MSELVRLTGLWKNTKKDGSTYLGGSLGAAKLIIFPNDHKEKERDPDYIVYLAKPQGKGEAQEEEKSVSAFDF